MKRWHTMGRLANVAIGQVKSRGIITTLALSLFTCLFSPHALAQSSCDVRFPLHADSPARKGASVSKLVELTNWIAQSPARIFSITISKDGAVVYELYSAGIGRDDAHYLMSVTKTFTSALVGAAIQRGKISGVDKSIAELLPRKLFDVGGLEKFKLVTLRDVMAMSALDAQVPPHQVTEDTKLRQRSFLAASNRVEFALRQKLLPNVGRDFQYTDITPYLAGGAIQYATNESLLDFANDSIFKVMDYRNAEWMHSDPSGISNPSYGLRLRPIDMQKFGILYLNEGCWNGIRLLPVDWVEKSFAPWIHARPNESFANYGWFWWTNRRDRGWIEHQANGWKGQRISVFAEQRVVVTMTGAIEDGSEGQIYNTIINDFIIPSFDHSASQQEVSTPEDLKNALLEVSRNKKALNVPMEYRMIPSASPKEKPRPFHP